MGLRLKELRKEHNLTQADVAKYLGVTQQGYTRYELEQRELGYDLLLKLAEFYNTSVDYLLGREKITPEERAAGLRETMQVSITPLEDDLLNAFREIGKKYGVDGQNNVLTLLNTIFEIKS